MRPTIFQSSSQFVKCLFVILVFSCTILKANSKYVEGKIDGTVSKNNLATWEFLTRFCFKSAVSNLTFIFKYPVALGSLEFLLYFDGQWPEAYGSNKVCTDRAAVLNTGSGSGQIIDLRMLSSSSVTCSQAHGYTTCTGGRVIQTARDRWWFLVLANCNGFSLKGAEYRLWLKNGEDGDIFKEEFSADEFYVLPVDIAFLCAYLILLTLCIVAAVFLYNKKYLHTTYRLFMVSVVLNFIHLLVMCVNGGAFSVDGVERSALKIFGQSCEGVSLLLFLLYLVLIAKGYTVTRGRMSRKSSIVITVFFVIYLIVFIVLFFYQAFVFDPGLVLYLYESPPGYAMIGLRILGWIWFCYAIAFTLKHHPKKSPFYYPFFLYYTLWFWIGPIIILISMHMISLWMREQIVNAVENFVMLLGHSFILVLSRPSKANKNFPYHVRTTQIEVMQVNGVEVTSEFNLDNFAAYPYAPSEQERSPQLGRGLPPISTSYPRQQLAEAVDHNRTESGYASTGGEEQGLEEKEKEREHTPEPVSVNPGGAYIGVIQRDSYAMFQTSAANSEQE